MLKKIMALLAALILFASVGYAEGGKVVFAFESYNYEVNKENTLKLKPILQGAKLPEEPKYTWESDNADVATVRRGTVTGVSAGEANISCTLKLDGEEYTATCTVRVLQPVTSIKFDVKDWKMMEGTSMKFEPEVLPENADNRKLRFFSSNPAIATIDSDGVIKAKDRGTCMIVAEATDGSEKKLEKKLTVATFLMDLDEIVFTEKKTYTLQLPVLEHPNNLNAYYLRMEGNCFSVGGIYIDRTYGTVIGTYGDSQTLKINPVKAGTGTLTIMDDNAYFGTGESGARASHKITIRVEPSAVYSEKTYPMIEYDKLMKDVSAYEGEQVSVKGVVAGVEILPCDEKMIQFRYTVATSGSDKKCVFVLLPPETATVVKSEKTEKGVLVKMVDKESPLLVGDKITVYGEYIEPITYETETGLTMQTPQILAESMNGLSYSKDMEQLVVHDITDR